MAARSAVDDDEQNEEGSAGEHINRLRAAVHYTVGKICEETAVRANERQAAESPEHQQSMTFSKTVVAAIADLTFKQAQLFSSDLVAFAKHANRTTVNVDDVKLLVRRNPSLLEHITKLADEMALEKQIAAGGGGPSEGSGAGSKKRGRPSKINPGAATKTEKDAAAGPSKPRLSFTIDDDIS